MCALKIGSYNLPVWVIIITMVGAGSMTISGSDLINPDFETTLYEDDVPNAASNTFTGIPVHFDRDDLVTLSVSGNGAKAGAHVITSQQLKIDMLMQVADPVTVTVPITNESEDSAIVVVKVTADPKVLVDIEEGFSTNGVRLVGTNQWIMTVDDNADADFKLEVVALEVRSTFLFVEIFSVS